MFDFTTFASLIPQIASIVAEDTSIPNPQVFRKSFALGGIVAEGGEVVQEPGQEAKKLKGPSHAKGGIEIDAPSGTVIFSKKVKGPDGRSMADRKMSRDQQLKKIQNALRDNKADAIHKATAERSMQNIIMEEMSDINTMMEEFAKTQQKGKKIKAETGYVVDPSPDSSFYGESPAKKRKVWNGYKWDQPFDPYYFQKKAFPNDPSQWDNEVGPKTAAAMGTPEGQKILQNMAGEYTALNTPGEVGPNGIPMAPSNPLTQAVQNQPPAPVNPISVDTTGAQISPSMPGTQFPAEAANYDIFSPEPDPYAGLTYDPAAGDTQTTQVDGTENTAGDIASIAGPVGKTLTTIFNRLGDRPTPNYYQNFGNEALQANTQSLKGTNEARDMEMQRNNALVNALRFNKTGRSINTARAYDVATLTEAGKNANRISATYNRVLSDLMSKRGMITNQQDRAIAEGQKYADTVDNQNRDAFATNIGKNIGDIATGVQHREQNQLRRKLGVTNEASQGISQLQDLLSQLL